MGASAGHATHGHATHGRASAAVAPSRPPLPWFLRWPGLLLATAVALAYRGAEGEVAALFSADAGQAMSDFAGGFWPPAHGAEFLGLMVRPLLETVAIAFLGMTLALVLSVPLSFLAASPEVLASSAERPGAARRGAWFVARLGLNLMRSIPELIWALVFVRALGIGPAAGVLAIGVGYAGILGKVFAEIFESVPRGPVEGLAASGTPPLRAFAFGVVPSALPMMGSYALYRFDCALRVSALLGVVGAGGLGQQLELSLKMFAYDEVAAQVLALFVLVASVDWASQRVRRRIHQSRGLLPLGRRALWGRLAALAGWAGAVTAAARFLDLPFAELFSRESAQSIATFLSGLYPPDLAPGFLAGLGPAVLETLSVSVLGTAIAAVVGLGLAYPAAYRLHGTGGGRSRRVFVSAMSWLARGLANLGRTLPELLWALIFIFAVGLGPFAGALALGVHTAGVLGRLYAEALEEVPPGPLEALRATGARPFGATLFSVLPQAFPQLVAYTLYRWEVNIRASAVLGVVGAGGLGKQLHLSLGLFQHDRTATLILVILAMVTAVDLLSGWLRRRVHASGGRQSARALDRASVEALAEGRRLLVLELDRRGARLFARAGESAAVAGASLPLML
ncbi:MAG TPA: phosphonate ABC transporter, permease protein PhnE, partial [Longimicrobium sp.]|nr:phosphonate ABC transporter, permease protein PhnE [Longimicrobium sp.]